MNFVTVVGFSLTIVGLQHSRFEVWIPGVGACDSSGGPAMRLPNQLRYFFEDSMSDRNLFLTSIHLLLNACLRPKKC